MDEILVVNKTIKDYKNLMLEGLISKISFVKAYDQQMDFFLLGCIVGEEKALGRNEDLGCGIALKLQSGSILNNGKPIPLLCSTQHLDAGV